MVLDYYFTQPNAKNTASFSSLNMKSILCSEHLVIYLSPGRPKFSMAQAQTSSQLDTVSPLVQGMFMVVIAVLTLTPFQRKHNGHLLIVEINISLVPVRNRNSPKFKSPIAFSNIFVKPMLHFPPTVSITPSYHNSVSHAHLNKNQVQSCSRSNSNTPSPT